MRNVDTEERLANNPWLGRHFFGFELCLCMVVAVIAIVGYAMNSGF